MSLFVSVLFSFVSSDHFVDVTPVDSRFYSR